MLYAIVDLYEVRDDGNAVEQRFGDDDVKWETRVNLKKLEVLTNDGVLSLPFKSCLDDKITGQNKYADRAEQTSKFEEIHEVMFGFVTFIS